MNKVFKRILQILLIIFGVIIGALILLLIISLFGCRSIYKDITLATKFFDKQQPTAIYQKATATNDAYLQKTDDSDFVILQLTDIHIAGSIFTVKGDRQAIYAVTEIVQNTQPDLIVLTGDSLFPMIYKGNINNKLTTKMLGTLFEGFGIPWTLAFGNHDAESFTLWNKDKQIAHYESLQNCLVTKGKNFDGDSKNSKGNFVIELKNKDGSLNQALFMMDCNGYDGGMFSYNYLRDQQVSWYEGEIDRLNTKFQKTANEPIKSMLFTHIPLFEYRTAYDLAKAGDKSAKLLRDGKNENICSTDKQVGKMFDAIINKKSTRAVFVGHDHVNTFAVDYTKDNFTVALCYSKSIDFVAYSKIDKQTEQRGAQLIYCSDDGLSIDTVSQTNNYKADNNLIFLT